MVEHAVLPVETPPTEAKADICPNRPLIDIRDSGEREGGTPAAAVPLSPEQLLDQCQNSAPGKIQTGYVICTGGVRSLKLVNLLHAEGYTGFSSITGGLNAWRQAGLPVAYGAGLSTTTAERYARHLVMPQVGLSGQQKLFDSRILLVGLGGLNSPVSLYLAAAGVGCLGLLDDDHVERSNLQRQIIHGESVLGVKKAISAAERIGDLNPDIKTEILDCRIDESNADDMVQDWDIIVDGTDNFPTRFALNDACVRHSKPLVYGAVMRFQGQVSVFWPAAPTSGSGPAPCFRCLMPVAPAPEDVPGCSEAGVLGVLPGIVGTLQASEALKLALGIGRPLLGSLLMLDALNLEFRETRITARPDCPSCGDIQKR